MTSITLYIGNNSINVTKDVSVEVIVHDLQKNIESSNSLYDNFENVKIDNIEYKSYIKNKDVKIAYFESVQLNSRNNLDILDFSWQLPNNNPNLLDDNSHYIIENNPNFTSNYENILITDKYTTDQNANLLPLWYKHKSSKITKVTEIEEFRSYYETKEYYSGYLIENGVLYTNYKNIYDYENDSYRFYIVTGIDSSGTIYKELLNRIPVFNEASWEDIYYNDADINDVANGSFKNDVYTVQEVRNRWNFNIFFVDGFTARTCNNGLNGFFWKPEVDKFIKLKQPNAVYSYDPWHIRIQSSSVYQGLNGVNYKYSIPEYLKQPYNPIFPCIKQNEKNCTKVTANIIKLPSNKIKFDPNQNINLEIILFDYNENPYAAYTTDLTKSNSVYGYNVNNMPILYKYNSIKSIDENNSFVEVSDSFENADIVKCTYYEATDEFVYLNVDLNPVNNKFLKDHKIIFYLKPQQVPIQEDSNWRAIEHLVVNKYDVIVSHSNYNNLSLNINDNESSYIDFLNNNFIGYNNEKQYMLLGEIFYKDDSKLEDCFSFNFQNNNGRYFDLNKKNYKKNYKLLLSKFGFGINGMPLQMNNLLYLSVPKKIYELKEETFLEKFYTYLETTITSIKDVDSPEFDLKVKYSFLDLKVIRFNFEGTGRYELYIDNHLETTKVFEEIIKDEYIDVVTTNVTNNTKKIKLVYTPNEKSNYYSNVYINEIKWRM